MLSSKVYLFPHRNNKSKEFHFRCYIVKLILYFFSIFSPFQCIVYLVAQITFITFEMAPIFLVTLFSFLRRTIYSTSKVHYRQFQVLMAILNKKTSCEYFQHLQLKEPTIKPIDFIYRKLLLMNVSKTLCGMVLVLL